MVTVSKDLIKTHLEQVKNAKPKYEIKPAVISWEDAQKFKPSTSSPNKFASITPEEHRKHQEEQQKQPKFVTKPVKSTFNFIEHERNLPKPTLATLMANMPYRSP
jgi:hypothetical protein